MNGFNNNHVLFEKSIKQLNLETKVLRETTNASKTGPGSAVITRRPISLEPRVPDVVDNGSLEELIEIKSKKPHTDKAENASKREAEDAIRSYHNRSLSPRLVAERIDRVSKRAAEDAVRKSQNRSLSPKLLQKADSRVKVVGDELSEHIRHLREKKENNINLPAISTSPLLQNLTSKNGLNRLLYNKDNRYTPAPYQAFQANRMLSEREYGSSPEYESSPSPGLDTEGDTDEEFFDNYIPISTFPYVQESEVSRHRKLNKDAEKNAKKKTLLSKGYLDYLQRLKLSRRSIEKKEKEAKDAKIGKKKTALKPGALKSKLMPEPKVETPPPEIPAKNVEEYIKLGKVIQSFKYSYAINDYYNGRSRLSFDSLASDETVDSELKSGWLIKTLGGSVLNVERALPSCNPFEVRKRRQMLRARAAEETRLLRRTSTNESIMTKSSRVHFMEPVSRLQSIYERHTSSQSDLKSDTEKPEKTPTPRLSISERKQSYPESGILVGRRKSSMKVDHGPGESGETKKILIDMTAISTDR